MSEFTFLTITNTTKNMNNLRKQDKVAEYSAPECSVFGVCAENGFAASKLNATMSVDSAEEKYYGSF